MNDIYIIGISYQSEMYHDKKYDCITYIRRYRMKKTNNNMYTSSNYIYIHVGQTIKSDDVL